MEKYAAFISYRHKLLDISVARAIHTGLETYRAPASVRKKTGRKRVGRCFRDRDELPTSSDLAQDILDALNSSDWLIVVCTPYTPKSKWCLSEIETFIKLHGRSRVLAVLAAGEPDESFPDILRFETLPDGTRVEHEPLAADVRADGVLAMRRKLRIEKLRLLAPMLGVGFDELRRRARERAFKIAVVASAFIALFFAVFGGYALSQAAVISSQNDEIAQKNDDLTTQIAETNRQKDLAQSNEQEATKQAGIAKDNEARAVAGETEATLQAGIARENEARAIIGEAEAKRQAGIALTNEELAKENEAKAFLSEAEANRQAGIARENASTAESQRAIAEEQRNTAQSNEAWAIRERNAALTSQSKFLSGISRETLASGDPATAALLALEALPKDLSNPERPLVDEAVAALRGALTSRQEGEYTLAGGVQSAFGENWHYLENDEILAVNSDKSWYYYQLPNGQLLGDGPAFESYSPERSLIASRRGVYADIYRLSDLSAPALSIYGPGSSYNIRFCPGGQYFIRVNLHRYQENFVELVETDTGRQAYRISDADFFPEKYTDGDNSPKLFSNFGFGSVCISPDGRFLALTLNGRKPDQAGIYLFDLMTGKKARDLIEWYHPGELKKPADWDEYSKDYDWDAWKDLYATTLPWVDRCETVEVPEAYGTENFLFSPDGRFLCVADIKDNLYIFSTETGRLVFRTGIRRRRNEGLDEITDMVSSQGLDYAPALAQVLDEFSREKYADFAAVTALFSPDSGSLAVLHGDGIINTFYANDAQSWHTSASSDKSKGPIFYMGYTGENTLVFKRGETSTELSFDKYGAQPVGIPNLYTPQKLTSSAIQTFGNGFVAYSANGAYQLWEQGVSPDLSETPVKELVRRALLFLEGRTLTAQERERYFID